VIPMLPTSCPKCITKGRRYGKGTDPRLAPQTNEANEIEDMADTRPARSPYVLAL